MARVTPKQQRRQRLVRRTLWAVGFVALAAVVALGWHWQRTLPLRTVEVSGTVLADTTALLDLAAVPDSAMLFDLDPALLADRVQRHPWVADARVTRWMTGTLGIDVTERVPVALVLDGAGRPAYFFDAAGFRMPAVVSATYDVPLLSGVFPEYQPTQPTDDAAVLDLLTTLATLPPAVDALVSTVERSRDGTFTLVTSPGPAGAVPVALGRGGFTEKLQRLHAFWDQAILTRPETPVRRIDLRFDGQIVTQESND